MPAEKFEIAIPEADLAELRARLAATRWADDAGNADWRYGVERGWLADMVDHWRHRHDWRAEEARLNACEHFRAEIDGVPLHFVHARGRGTNPVPLLLVHGWPWTFADYLPLVGPLTDPAAYGLDPAICFDVVIPSLPGFAFSTPLTRTGLDIPAHAAMFDTLMHRVLGYPRYAVGGGDWGAAITTWMGHAVAERVIGVLTSIPYFPGLDVFQLTPDRYAADEQWMLARKAETAGVTMSHFVVQSSDPQTLAYALTDSPVGTAAWLWERRMNWSDVDRDALSDAQRDGLCTLASLLWLTRSIGMSLRTYWEHMRAGGLPMAPVNGHAPPIPVPCGVLVYPKEVMLVPRAAAERGMNLRHWKVMPRGGHFGLAEFPDDAVAEIRGFFSSLG